jgi:hypothetical protein
MIDKYKEQLEKEYNDILYKAKKEYEEKLVINDLLLNKFNRFLPILETLFLEVSNIYVHNNGIRVYTKSIDGKFKFFDSHKRVQQQKEITKMAIKIDNLFDFCVRVIPSSLENEGISKDLENTVVFNIPLVPYTWNLNF